MEICRDSDPEASDTLTLNCSSSRLYTTNNWDVSIETMLSRVPVLSNTRELLKTYIASMLFVRMDVVVVSVVMLAVAGNCSSARETVVVLEVLVVPVKVLLELVGVSLKVVAVLLALEVVAVRVLVTETDVAVVVTVLVLVIEAVVAVKLLAEVVDVMLKVVLVVEVAVSLLVIVLVV